MLSSVGERVYSDEQVEFRCNTAQPGCNNVCFNTFSPISHVRFWGIQIIMVCLPSIVFLIYTGHLTKTKLDQEKSNKEKAKHQEDKLTLKLKEQVNKLNAENKKVKSNLQKEMAKQQEFLKNFERPVEIVTLKELIRDKLIRPENSESENQKSDAKNRNSVAKVGLTFKKNLNCSKHNPNFNSNNNYESNPALQNFTSQMFVSAAVAAAVPMSVKNAGKRRNLVPTSNPRPGNPVKKSETSTCSLNLDPNEIEAKIGPKPEKPQFCSHMAPILVQHYGFYFLSVCGKAAIEIFFLNYHRKHFGFEVPEMVKCNLFPCPGDYVDCFVSRSLEKTYCINLMFVFGCINLGVNFAEILYLIVNFIVNYIFARRFEKYQELRTDVKNDMVLKSLRRMTGTSDSANNKRKRKMPRMSLIQFLARKMRNHFTWWPGSSVFKMKQEKRKDSLVESRKIMRERNIRKVSVSFNSGDSVFKEKQGLNADSQDSESYGSCFLDFLGNF